MEISRIADLRPRFVWDIVDDAFDLYRERFFSFFWVTAAAYVPVILFVVATLNSLSQTAAKDDGFTMVLAAIFVVIPFTCVASFIVRCATTELVSAFLNGSVFPRLSLIYGKVFKRFWALFGALLFIATLSTLGSFTSGLVSLYVLCATIFIVPAILIEARGLRSSYRRSYRLANANLPNVFGLIMIIFALTALLLIGLFLICTIIFTVIPRPLHAITSHAPPQTIFEEILFGLAVMLLEPISAIAITLFYFDLRVRREGIDLVAAATESGVTLAADPFGDLPSDNVLRLQRRNKRK